MTNDEKVKAVKLLRRLDQDTEDLVDLLLDRSPEELIEVARLSKISFKGIELRVKTIRSGYRFIGRVKVKPGV